MHDTITRGLIELTVLTKSGGSGPLGKRIFLDVSGKIVSDGSACTMSRGRATRVRIDDLGELAALIEGLTSKQAIALGALRDELPDEVRIVTKAALAAGVATNDAVARTAENLVYRSSRPALTLLDYDTKGMPPAVRGLLGTGGGFWTALVVGDPCTGDSRVPDPFVNQRRDEPHRYRRGVPRIRRPHGLVMSADGTDAVRFLKTLHARCWLAGYGWMNVGAAGQLLERSIVDRMVGAAERLVFEGPPEVVPPLHQDAAARRPTVVAGEVLDTRTACPQLSIVEQSRLDELKNRERERLAPEKAKARAAFVERQAKKLAASQGITEAAAKASSCGSATAYCGRMSCCRSTTRTCPGALSAMCSPTLNASKAKRWRIRWRASEDGPCKAKIMRYADGTPWIHCSLMATPSTSSSTRRRGQGRWSRRRVRTWWRLCPARPGADIDEVELEALRQLAKESPAQD